MLSKIRSLTLLLVFLLALAGNALAVNYRLILIDRTGSMASVRSDGTTRLQTAKELAVGDVNQFPDGDTIAVMYFDSNGIILSLDFTTTKADVINAIRNVPEPGANTPLADAMCKGAQILKNKKGAISKLLYTYTDGYENASTGSDVNLCDPCDGQVATGWYNDCDPSDNIPPCSDWQNCLANALIQASVHWVRYFGSPISAAEDVFATGGSMDLSTISPVQTSEGVIFGSEDFAFLKYVAEQSGGGIIDIPDTLPPPPPIGIPFLGNFGILVLSLFLITTAWFVLSRRRVKTTGAAA